MATTGASLVGLQTFMKSEEWAPRAPRRGKRVRSDQPPVATACGDGPHIREALETLYSELDRIARASPVIPDRFYWSAQGVSPSTVDDGRVPCAG
jgi:hypothetical protein